METIEAVLRDVPLFEGLTQEELRLLAGCASNVRFEEGERIFRDGDPADTFYVVRHGAVALEMFDQIAERHPAVAGAMSFVDRETEVRLERLQGEMRRHRRLQAAG